MRLDFEPDGLRLNAVSLIIVCQVHRFRAQPLITVRGEKTRMAAIYVNGEPQTGFLMHGTFSAQCTAEDPVKGRCHIRRKLNFGSLLTLADYLRFGYHDTILDTHEIGALINHPARVRRYLAERAKINSGSRG